MNVDEGERKPGDDASHGEDGIGTDVDYLVVLHHGGCPLLDLGFWLDWNGEFDKRRVRYDEIA